MFQNLNPRFVFKLCILDAKLISYCCFCKTAISNWTAGTVLTFRATQSSELNSHFFRKTKCNFLNHVLFYSLSVYCTYFEFVWFNWTFPFYQKQCYHAYFFYFFFRYLIKIMNQNIQSKRNIAEFEHFWRLFFFLCFDFFNARYENLKNQSNPNDDFHSISYNIFIA